MALVTAAESTRTDSRVSAKDQEFDERSFVVASSEAGVSVGALSFLLPDEALASLGLTRRPFPDSPDIPVHRRLLFSIACHRYDLDTIRQIHQPDAHGLPRSTADITGHGTQYAPAACNGIQLIVKLDH